VSVDTGVSSSASQIFVLLVWNMLMRLAISIPLGQPKVDQMNDVALSAQAHQEVLRLDVSVHKVLGMKPGNSPQHLVSNHEDRLQGEPTPAELEQVLERRS